MACHYEVRTGETRITPESSTEWQEWTFEPYTPALSEIINHEQTYGLEAAATRRTSPDVLKLVQHRHERFQLDNFAVFTGSDIWTPVNECLQVPPFLMSKGWAVVEAVAYRNKVVKNDNADLAVAKSSHNVAQQPQPFDPYSDVIVAAALCARIRFLAVAQDTEPDPATRDDTFHLWSRLYQLLNSSCQSARQQITDIDNVINNKVLQRICKMSAIEDYLAMPGARAHLEGFLALLRRCGTPAQIGKKELSLGNAIHRILINAVVGNTLTRHSGGFVQIYAFTNQELTHAYKLTICNDFPCPSQLWEQLLNIAELRAASHTGLSGQAVKERAEQLYTDIGKFAPEAWKEPYSLPKPETAYLLAAIFKAAASIYCCSCYPPSSDEVLVNWIDSVRTAQRTALLRLINQAFEKGNLRWCLTWPLAVLGYAVDSGSFSERAMVNRLLGEMGGEYSPMPLRVRVRLQRFWDSNERSWDKCWQEPAIFTV